MRDQHDHSHDTSTPTSCCAGEEKVNKTVEAGSCHETPTPDNATHSASHGSSCCADDEKRRFDWILWGSLLLVAVGYIGRLTTSSIATPKWFHHYADGSFELMNAMWWGLAIGIFFVGLLGEVPRETVVKLLGKGGTWNGLLRATGAGVMLDLCSHGILAVGMKLYERGASVGQVMAFLIASPWNSFSLTLILFGLIGVSWTLLFIFLSLVIALISGRIFDALVKSGKLPDNPNRFEVPEGDAPTVVSLLKSIRFSFKGSARILTEGFRSARMVIRWALFGVVIAGLIRAFVPADIFADWFGPTTLGLLLTLVAATIIEVCSEGSVPIAADLMTRAAAPGNTFTFLMAGVSTDYTEIMTIRDTAKSWKLALALPLITIPQVLVIGFILNMAGG